MCRYQADMVNSVIPAFAVNQTYTITSEINTELN